jgi:hypothetical protein
LKVVVLPEHRRLEYQHLHCAFFIPSAPAGVEPTPELRALIAVIDAMPKTPGSSLASALLELPIGIDEEARGLFAKASELCDALPAGTPDRYLNQTIAHTRAAEGAWKDRNWKKAIQHLDAAHDNIKYVNV